MIGWANYLIAAALLGTALPASAETSSEPVSDKAQILLDEAEKAIHAGRLVQADKLLAQIELDQPNATSPRTLMLRAKYHAANGNVTAAAEQLSRVDLAAVYRCDHASLSGWVATENGRWNTAILQLASAVEQCADNPLLWNLLGLALSGKGEYAAAVEAYDSALLAKPGHPALINNRALALIGIGKPQMALESLAAALAAEPNNAAIRSNIDYLSGMTGLQLIRQDIDSDAVWAQRMARAGEGAAANARKSDAAAYFANATILMDHFDPQIWRLGELANQAAGE